MNASAVKKIALALAGMVSIGAATQVSAAPAFTVNQGAITGGTYTNPQMFTATQSSGNAAELVRFSNSFQTANVNSGFLRLDSLFNANTLNSIGINASSTAGNYGLYVLFNLQSTYDASQSTGAPGSAGSTYRLSSLNFTLFADTNGDTTFQAPNAAGAGTEANRSTNFGDDVLLAFGSLLNPTSSANVVGFNSGGGAFENALTSFAICTGVGTAKVGGTVVPGAGCASGEGINYFAAPVPFYPLSFNAFNNTGNSLAGLGGNNLAISQSIGAISFQAVPEPSTVALFGIAALGMGLAARRRRRS